MVSDCFEIVLARVLAPEQIAQAFSSVAPAGTRVDVQAVFPDALGGVWVRAIESHDDLDWPSLLVVSCLDVPAVSPYLDLLVAEQMWERFGVDCFCMTHPFVQEGLDPFDPFWALACVKGRWYLADTSGTRLPATDGGGLRLVRPVEIPW